MKEKMPITPVTPVPVPSTAIAAEAARDSEETLGADTPDEREPAIAPPRIQVAEDSADSAPDSADSTPKMSARGVSVFYGEKQALKDVSVDIREDRVTAFIGPSGCGKSTFLRCLNRMNDTIAGARVTGHIALDGEDIHSASMDVVQLRARVGMVFQKPNPFPKSIYENVAYGPRIHGLADGKAELSFTFNAEAASAYPAPVVREVAATRAGWVARADARTIAVAAMHLGAGRRVKTSYADSSRRSRRAAAFARSLAT